MSIIALPKVGQLTDKWKAKICRGAGNTRYFYLPDELATEMGWMVRDNLGLEPTSYEVELAEDMWSEMNGIMIRNLDKEQRDNIIGDE